MVKYFFVQCKRLLRYFPGTVLVAVALMLCMLGAYDALTADTSQEDGSRVKVAFAGETDNMFLQMGISAVSNFDSTRFAMEVIPMEQEAALAALQRGDIAVCVIMPEGFMENAMQGQLMPLQFVTTTGSSSLVTIFKNEITQVVSNLLVSSQKGVFAYSDVLGENGFFYDRGAKMDLMSLEYVDYIIARDQMYSLEELGIGDRLPLEDYLLCGLTILLFMLICLPFGPMLISGEPALGRMLKSRGVPPLSQVFTEFVGYTLFLGLLLCLLLAIAAPRIGFPEASQWLPAVLPVILVITAFSFMLYSCADHIIGGMLMYFFIALALCFVSGCLYPVFFFPVTLQKLAAWLPTGLARSQLAGCLTGGIPDHNGLYLFGYSCVFFAVGAFVRCRRIKGVARQ